MVVELRRRRFWEACTKFTAEIHLFVVTQHHGSSPGKRGFHMALSGGMQAGTIGGGAMEKQIVEDPDAVPEGVIERVHRSSSENFSGLICSGSQIIYHAKFPAGLVDRILQGYSEKSWIHYTAVGVLVANSCTQQCYYHEQLTSKHTVNVFGGGHVGKAITKVLSDLDFEVNLYDQRDIPLIRDNPYATNIYTGSYFDTFTKVDGAFQVVCNYSMADDIDALFNIAETNSEYVGLMGSKAKYRKIKEALSAAGVSEEFIGSIKCPIGLAIDDGSPEEIAIAVVAELIQRKNSMQ